MSNTVSFLRHVHNSINPYRWGMSIVVSVLASMLFAGYSLHTRVNTDQEMLSTLAPYLSTLIESQDRPEILRVLQSVAETRKSDVILVQDGNIFASSRSVSEMDTAFNKPKLGFRLFNSTYSKDTVISDLIIKKDGFPEFGTLYLFSPLLPILRDTLGVALLTLLICLIASAFSASQMRKAIRKALLPLDQLQEEIKGLHDETTRESSPIRVSELEEIRKTISKAKHDLENAKDKLAEEKAKKLSAESYKRLIHDLHNPVAALRQMLRVLGNSEIDEPTRDEAMIAIPRIADQILNQITSAKKNLEDEPITLKELDVRTCVESCVQQVSAIIPPEKSIELVLPKNDVLIAHDPNLLKRAIVNLIENGIEAAKKEVQIFVEAKNDYTSISVSDDGCGMDESKVSMYLQGRGQSGKANRQAFGLSSTNHIVRSHGGKIIYKKSKLGGASFEIRLGAV